VYSARNTAGAASFLRVNDHARDRLGFFGFIGTPDGYSLSGQFPASDSGRAVGIGGLVADFLYQPLGYHLFPYIAASPPRGSIANLWLLCSA